MKRLRQMLLLFVWASSFWVLEMQAGQVYNTNKDGVLLDGVDAVSYFQRSGPAEGQSQFSVKRQIVTYLFANENNKQKFLKNPEMYEPQ